MRAQKCFVDCETSAGFPLACHHQDNMAEGNQIDCLSDESSSSGEREHAQYINSCVRMKPPS